MEMSALSTERKLFLLFVIRFSYCSPYTFNKNRLSSRYDNIFAFNSEGYNEAVGEAES